MATSSDPPGTGHQPERPKRPDSTERPDIPESRDRTERPGVPESRDSSETRQTPPPETPERPDAHQNGQQQPGQRQPTRRMPTHELPDHYLPPRHLPPRPTRPDLSQASREPQRRQPHRPYWGPPIVPGAGAGWQGEAPGGLPPERYVGRARQYVLTTLIGLITISLVVFFIVYWNRDTDRDPQSNPRPQDDATAQATGPDGSEAEEPPGEGILPVAEVTATANEFYSQARAGQFELILNQACDDVAAEDTSDNVDAMSDRYDDLISWTVEDVQPTGEEGSAVVSASLRYADEATEESEESLLFIDEGGWRYCGSG